MQNEYKKMHKQRQNYQKTHKEMQNEHKETQIKCKKMQN